MKTVFTRVTNSLRGKAPTISRSLSTNRSAKEIWNAYANPMVSLYEDLKSGEITKAKFAEDARKLHESYDKAKAPFDEIQSATELVRKVVEAALPELFEEQEPRPQEIRSEEKTENLYLQKVRAEQRDAIKELLRRVKENDPLLKEISPYQVGKYSRYFQREDLMDLIAALKTNTNITRFSYPTGVVIDDEVILAMADLVKSNSTLQEVGISFISSDGKNDVTLDAERALAKSLEQNRSLTKVTIVHDDPSDVLFESLSKNPRLKEVSFIKSGNYFENSRLVDNLVKFLKKNTNVEELEVVNLNFYKEFDKKDIARIAAAVNENTALKSFSLNNCKAEGNIFATFIASMKNNRSLTHLGLRRGRIEVKNSLDKSLGEEGEIEDIADLILNNSTLTSIDLGYNFIFNPENLKVLATALEGNKTLQSLYLERPVNASKELVAQLEKIEELLERNRNLAEAAPSKVPSPLDSSRAVESNNKNKSGPDM